MFAVDNYTGFGKKIRCYSVCKNTCSSLHKYLLPNCVIMNYLFLRKRFFWYPVRKREKRVEEESKGK